MASAKGRNKFMFDAEPSITLRNVADGAEVATASELPVTLNTLVDAYWDDNEVPFGSKEEAEVVIQVSAVVTAVGDETYVLSVEVADDAAFATNVHTIASLPVTAVGTFGLEADPDIIESLTGTAKFLRVTATLAGVAPSITYGAWLA